MALFDSTHKNNMATGSKPSIDSIQKMMLKLLRQTDPFGEAITIQPKYIIVPVGYGFTLSQLLETQILDVAGIGNHTVNPLYNYRNQLQVIEEGTLNALAGEAEVPWFMVGDLKHHEEEFAELLAQKTTRDYERERQNRRQRLQEMIARNKEVDRLFERIYEDNVSGKLRSLCPISNTSFVKLR